MKPASRRAPSTTVNLTVAGREGRRYLTEREIERLMDCARKHSRHGHRDVGCRRAGRKKSKQPMQVRDPTRRPPGMALAR